MFWWWLRGWGRVKEKGRPLSVPPRLLTGKFQSGGAGGLSGINNAVYICSLIPSPSRCLEVVEVGVWKEGE